MAEEILTVIFTLGSEEYGVDVHSLHSIGQLTPLEWNEEMPSFMKGVTVDRRIPIVNLHARLGADEMQATEESRLFYFEVDGIVAGVEVDHANNVISIKNEQFKPLHTPLTNGLADLEDGRMIVMLNLQSILSDEEIRILKEGEWMASKNLGK